MKIGIVNDMRLAVAALRRALAIRPDFEIAWVANDGKEAIARCAAQTPDVVLMDLVMPNMDGVAATRHIMAQSPCAILVVTVDIGANAWRVYEAMGAGALDAVDTPALAGADAGRGAAALIAKIDQIGARLSLLPVTIAPGSDARLLAIGASAGGPAALATLLGALPDDFAPATVIVQHVDRAFAEGMAQWLDGQSALRVRIARAGDTPVPNEVLLAATNDHLNFTDATHLGYTAHPQALPYRPSVDVFFQSVVERWTGRAVGVLLTGMGRDGAIGLKAMRAKGYHTIAQDEATSAVYGMPKAAAALDAAAAILPLPRMAHALARAFDSDARITTISRTRP